MTDCPRRGQVRDAIECSSRGHLKAAHGGEMVPSAWPMRVPGRALTRRPPANAVVHFRTPARRLDLRSTVRVCSVQHCTMYSGTLSKDVDRDHGWLQSNFCGEWSISSNLSIDFMSPSGIAPSPTGN